MTHVAAVASGEQLSAQSHTGAVNDGLPANQGVDRASCCQLLTS